MYTVGARTSRLEKMLKKAARLKCVWNETRALRSSEAGGGGMRAGPGRIVVFGKNAVWPTEKCCPAKGGGYAISFSPIAA
jgi:hypothetical protein